MPGLVRALAFDLSGGADRRRSSLTRPPNRLLDVVNLLPRTPLGAKVVRAPSVVSPAVPSGIAELLAASRPGGALALLARSGSGYQDLLGGGLPAVSFSPGSAIHDMAPYRGKIAIAQQGAKVQLLDLEAGTCEELAESPRAGLACEFKGMLWAAGDTGEDDSSPSVTIPLVGVVIPPPQLEPVASGTANITYSSTTKTSAIQSTSTTPGAFTGMVGKIVVVGGKGYKIETVTTTTLLDDTATVKALSGEPDSAEGVAYQVLSSVPLVAYPAALDLGDVFLFAESGPVDCRLFNLWTVPIRITAVRPKGSQVKALNLPPLPATIPPGGSFSFSVTFTPETEGECQASIVVEHDFYAQDSLVIPVTCTGTDKEVLATPSVLHFGAWLAGSASPFLPIQIQNPLSDPIVLKASGWATTGIGTEFVLESPLPTGDVTIEPGKSYTLKAKFAPSPGASGALTASITYKRVVPAKPFRVWRSRPGDPKAWDRDREWVDLSADGLAGGEIRSLQAYDDALICLKDASAWAIVPSGTGFRPVQLPLGEGIGTFGPLAVCVGGGILWFASKAGAYRLLGQDLKRISDPIEDLFQALTPDQFSQVRVAFYDGFFLLALPALPQLPASLWAYRPDYPDANGSWWRLDVAPTALAVDKGATRKEALYAIVGSQLQKLDAEEAAGTPWSIQTPLITGQDPTTLKKVVAVDFQVSEPGLLTTVTLEASNKTRAMATLLQHGSGASLSGVGHYDGALSITVEAHAYPDHALEGLSITFAGIQATVANHVGTTLTLSAPLGIPAMYGTFFVGPPAEGAPLVGIRGLFGEGAVACEFTLSAAGASVAGATARGEVAGLSVDYEPICLVGVAE